MAAGSVERSCTKCRSMLPQSIVYCLKELRYFSCNHDVLYFQMNGHCSRYFRALTTWYRVPQECKAPVYGHTPAPACQGT